MLNAVLGFFTGGVSIYAKIAVILGGIMLVGGAIWYVQNLRQNLEIAEAKVGVLQGSLDAERERNFKIELDHKVMRELTKDLVIEWKMIDLGTAKFKETVDAKLTEAVKEFKATPESEAARLKTQDTINAMSNASTRCSEIVVNGATEDDKTNPALKDFCPELLK